MKKGDRPNPGEEFFYKLSRKPEFQRDLIKARKQLCINENGFLDPRTRQKLWIEYKKADMLGLLGIEQYLKEKYGVPEPYRLFIDDYIFFGKPINALKSKNVVARIMYPPPPGFANIEDFYEAENEQFVKLLIFGNATKTGVIDFIKKNWREIELSLNINIHKKSRTRASVNKERDQEIRRLWRLSLEELQQKAGTDTTKEKDSLVAKVLVKMKFTKKELGGGTIRRIANEK